MALTDSIRSLILIAIAAGLVILLGASSPANAHNSGDVEGLGQSCVLEKESDHSGYDKWSKSKQRIVPPVVDCSRVRTCIIWSSGGDWYNDCGISYIDLATAEAYASGSLEYSTHSGDPGPVGGGWYGYSSLFH